MRLWTLHPKYLDARGLTALWREGLLARAVLRGNTRGYRHHPQLHRFRAQAAPGIAIDAYLGQVLAEADARGYAFDRGKIDTACRSVRLFTTTGQLGHEWRHLLDKLEQRDPDRGHAWRGIVMPEPHPLFSVRVGPVELWERAG